MAKLYLNYAFNRLFQNLLLANEPEMGSPYMQLYMKGSKFEREEISFHPHADQVINAHHRYLIWHTKVIITNFLTLCFNSMTKQINPATDNAFL